MTVSAGTVGRAVVTVDTPRMIPCVIYSAKSTEDLRGSLLTQADDCRRSIVAEGDRRVVAEYLDEAVSGFSSSRGPGLSAALEQARALAGEHGRAELWVQHSDRLARGDGRAARHLVEIALWALKVDVTVRTVEDVDTFRDLLYAVVTGQRNHEDSKRKGAATAAGLKRAVYRGEYAGQPLDGYRVLVTADEHGHVTKTLDINPARKPLFALIFRMAHQGANSGEIARRVNRAGWLTAPRRRTQKAAPFTPAFIRWILANPRYAGLAFYKGEIVAKGQWPAYISRREHERIVARLRQYKPRTLPREPFLLARTAGCGECGSYMITTTGVLRRDGTRSRRYVCNEHRLGRCPAPPVDAAVVDHVFVAHLNRFLGAPEEGEPYRPSPGFPRELIRGEPDTRWESIEPIASMTRELKVRIQRALAAHDEELADKLLAELIAHREQLHKSTHTPAIQMAVRDRSLTQDPLSLLLDFYAWSSKNLAGELIGRQGETLRLTRVLQRWFARVMLRTTSRGIEIAPLLPTAVAGPTEAAPRTSPTPAYAKPDTWRAALQLSGYSHRGKDPWHPGEIIHALNAWAAEHGRAPHTRDWSRANPEHPSYTTVIDRFGRWNAALEAAGLTPAPVKRHAVQGPSGFVARCVPVVSARAAP
jgi:DNA invertase Pin-like site-specific DNA recombinase